MKRCNCRCMGGFTMIELVVAVAIILILVAVALASYQDYTARRARTQASTSLTELSKWLHQQRASIEGYHLASLPYAQVPMDGTARYRISLLKVDTHASDPKSDFPGTSEHAFTLQAEPVSDDACGALLLDSAGRRGVTGVGAHVDDCWAK